MKKEKGSRVVFFQNMSFSGVAYSERRNVSAWVCTCQHSETTNFPADWRSNTFQGWNAEI